MTGTVEDGLLKPDKPPRLESGTRVRLTVEPLQHPSVAQEAWTEFERVCDEIPIDSGGLRLTRDELHDRR